MASPPGTVLILTHTRDHFVIERVVDGLERRGARTLRLDTDQYPSRVRLTTSFDGDRHAARLADGTGTTLSAGDVRAVWARKFWQPELPNLDASIADGCRREIGAALHGWLDGFSQCTWVNELRATAQAENKPRQLRLAQALGFRVPRTLMTNDPSEVQAFREACGPLVAKMLTPLSTSMDGSGPFMHTTLLDDGDLAALEGLDVCPMVFQELIPKRVELRVACVGERAFAGAIDASRSHSGRIDWRLASPQEVSWTRWQLPESISDRLPRLLESLGLSYGAVDLIVTPDDEYVFLEVNPSGEWGMLERDLDLPVGDAIAAELLRGPA